MRTGHLGCISPLGLAGPMGASVFFTFGAIGGARGSVARLFMSS